MHDATQYFAPQALLPSSVCAVPPGCTAATAQAGSMKSPPRLISPHSLGFVRRKGDEGRDSVTPQADNLHAWSQWGVHAYDSCCGM